MSNIYVPAQTANTGGVTLAQVNTRILTTGSNATYTPDSSANWTTNYGSVPSTIKGGLDLLAAGVIYSTGSNITPVSMVPWHGALSSGSTANGAIVSATYTISGSDIYSWYIASATQFDYWTTYIPMVGGTYTFNIEISKAADRAIGTLYIDDVSKGTVDSYNGSAIAGSATITGVTIGTAGVPKMIKVQIRVDSKHASSTGYYFIWRRAGFCRTA